MTKPRVGHIMTNASAPPRSSLLISQIATVKVAAVVSAVILTGATFWALRRIFEPFVLALFLLIMVDGIARGLANRVPKFPAKATLPTAFLLILGLFALTIWVTADNAGDFAAQSGAYTARIGAVSPAAICLRGTQGGQGCLVSGHEGLPLSQGG